MAWQNHSKGVNKVSFQNMHGLMFVKKNQETAGDIN
jgi:hypothetical protein